VRSGIVARPRGLGRVQLGSGFHLFFIEKTFPEKLVLSPENGIFLYRNIVLRG
jgi:hypothetical protein